MPNTPYLTVFKDFQSKPPNDNSNLTTYLILSYNKPKLTGINNNKQQLPTNKDS